MYKLLNVHDGKLLSTLGGMVYKVGQWNWPKYGKLFVFENYNYALQHATLQSMSRFKIMKCTVINPSRIEKIAFSSGDFEAFWTGGMVISMDPPPGTFVVDGVYLHDGSVFT